MKANGIPEKIYITLHFQRRWFTKEIDDESTAYFSEQAVRNALMKAYTHANLLAGALQSRAKECARIRVENVINIMKGGEE